MTRTQAWDCHYGIDHDSLIDYGTTAFGRANAGALLMSQCQKQTAMSDCSQ
jgi:hypothetical protein